MLDKRAIEYTCQNATRCLIIIIIGVYRTKPYVYVWTGEILLLHRCYLVRCNAEVTN